MWYTAEGAEALEAWPNPEGWSTGHPWEMDVKAGVGCGCVVDAAAEGKHGCRCGEDGRHG